MDLNGIKYKERRYLFINKCICVWGGGRGAEKKDICNRKYL